VLGKALGLWVHTELGIVGHHHLGCRVAPGGDLFGIDA
jgi:hypothetical protein